MYKPTATQFSPCVLMGNSTLYHYKTYVRSRTPSKHTEKTEYQFVCRLGEITNETMTKPYGK